MKGKRVIVTGATSGIGKEIAVGLAALGADLVLGCRDVHQGAKTADEIKHKTGAETVTVMHVDMASQRSIREFARLYRESHPRLDVLVNNAGVNRGSHPRETSVDGIELTFATNVLGYFVLTQELLGLLQASALARVVNVASTFASDLDLKDLQFESRKFEGVKAYAQSKACDRMLTWALARRLEKSGVTANAMAPGLVTETGLYRHSPPELMQRLRKISQRTSADGADTAIWLASSPDVEGINGKFFEDREQVECEFRNKLAEERLWTICEKLTGVSPSKPSQRKASARR
ncbi:MAG: SDR family oxidoreductase [Chloroflexi bacterium]|nr:SDR family oxidoreductase [Chloroflexota bacterium]